MILISSARAGNLHPLPIGQGRVIILPVGMARRAQTVIMGMIVVVIMGFDAGGAVTGRICFGIGHLARRSGAFRRGNQFMRNSITLFTLRRCCGVCSAR